MLTHAMSAITDMTRCLFACLLVLGLQLPCPCPAEAAPSHGDASSDAHGCCPGDDASVDTTDGPSPKQNPDHVCAHCADDHYVNAAAIALPAAKTVLDPDGSGLAAPGYFGNAGFLLAIIEAQGLETLIDRPPPDATRSPASGRHIRIHHCSFLC